MGRRCLLGLFAACLLAPADAVVEAEVSFSTPSKVGSVVVPAGLYRLKLQGALLLLTDASTKKCYTTLSRVEKTVKRSSFTAAMGKVVDGTNHVEAIVLKDADYKLVF